MQPPEEHPDIIVQDQQPFNAESPLGMLRQSFVTSEEIFYIRNHGSIPEVDPASYCLTVSGMVERPLDLSLEEIRVVGPNRMVESRNGYSSHYLLSLRQ